MDEWAVERDRNLQRERGVDPEKVSENDILRAMAAAGLKHVKYAEFSKFRGGQQRELTPEQEEKLKLSKQAHEESRRGRTRLDEPDLLRTVLKYYQGNVSEQTRVWRDFYSQFSKEELQAFYDMVNETSSPSKSLEESPISAETNPFYRKRKEWGDLLRSHHYALGVLEVSLQTDPKEAPTPSDLWYSVVLELMDHQASSSTEPTKET